ncbi:MAG: preprotein translocase subunit SecE [Oscillospiraceae bacterium]|jgi:preprotein translocase subunit SecE
MSEQEKQLDTNKESKTKAAKKKDKPGIFARIARWFREMKSELKKVQWPTWKQTWNNTLTVIVCVILIGLFIWIFDWAARWVIAALLELVKG